MFNICFRNIMKNLKYNKVYRAEIILNNFIFGRTKTKQKGDTQIL